MMLISAAKFFNVNVTLDKITLETIKYYMESDEFITLAKQIIGEDNFREYKKRPEIYSRVLGLAIAGLIGNAYSDQMAEDLDLLRRASFYTNGLMAYDCKN